MKEEKMSKYFITNDTALAAYLLLCGMKFIEATIWDDERMKKYIIVDTPERIRHEEDFYLRTTTVAPMDYHDARVTVSRYLKRQIRDPRLSEL